MLKTVIRAFDPRHAWRIKPIYSFIRLLALSFLAAAGTCESAVITYDTNNAVVQTFAGSGFSGYLDGQGTETMFDGWSGLAIVSDSFSNLFVLENFNRVRKITPTGTVSTFVNGTNTYSFYSMTIDRSNALWLAGAVFTPSTSIRTLFRVGSDTNLSIVYQGLPSPYGVGCVDSRNNVYISDSTANKIYRYRTNGVMEVFAGSGNQGSIDGNGVFTSFYSPGALAADLADNIYVWDMGNRLIRKINANRDVVTIAGKKGIASDSDGTGTNASFSSVRAMCVDAAGNVFLASGSSIRKMTATTNVLTVAGSFTQTGYTNGPGLLARFDGASGVCLSQGMLFVADSVNPRIRNITFDPVPEPVSGANLALDTYAGLKISGVVGRTYRIESSSAFNINWTTEATIVLPSSPYLWFDPAALGARKFYRAFLLP